MANFLSTRRGLLSRLYNNLLWYIDAYLARDTQEALLVRDGFKCLCAGEWQLSRKGAAAQGAGT